jgi:hypothetical protein
MRSSGGACRICWKPSPICTRMPEVACLMLTAYDDDQTLRASVYSLAQPALLGLLAAAEDVLAATGDAVALCPVYGQPR